MNSIDFVFLMIMLGLFIIGSLMWVFSHEKTKQKISKLKQQIKKK
ncbi:MAG: hypothetical protein ACRAS9_01520 [Mycoplasma sp.]